MHLGGSLPQDSSIYNSLSSLNLLDLSYNDLTGSVPQLQQLTSLQTLQLQGNKFAGPLPQLAGFSSLTTANFQENQFTGTEAQHAMWQYACCAKQNIICFACVHTDTVHPYVTCPLHLSLNWCMFMLTDDCRCSLMCCKEKSCLTFYT